MIAGRLGFVTVSNVDHLARTLVLARSLAAAAPGTCLHVTCIDRETEAVFRRLDLPNVRIVPASAVEQGHPVLRDLRSARTVREFAWTLKSAALLHVLDACHDVDVIAHIDSDFAVFADPEPLLRRELAGGSSLVIPHHRVLPAI